MVAALVAASAALTAWVTPAAPASADPPPFGYADSATIDVQGTPVQVDLDGSGAPTGPETRLWDVTVVSPHIFVPGTNPAPPAVVNPIHIPIKLRIYLPSGYDHGRAAGYPTLYLLHGGGGSYRDWSRPTTDTGTSCGAGSGSGAGSGGGDIVNTLAGTPFTGITVMIEGGCAGAYTDWYGETNGHFSPKWETFHTQLVDWIDDNLNTIDDRSGRSIAGLSMGGLGAMHYAGAHPELFSAVGSFSGAVEMRFPTFDDTLDLGMLAYGASVDPHGISGAQAYYYRITTGEPPEQERATRMLRVFGPSSPPVPPETRRGWPAINPVELAAAGAYEDYDGGDGKLAIYSGDSVAPNDGGESELATVNNALHATLNSTGVAHRYCRGFGKHEWSYWRNDLRDFLHYVYGTTPPTCTTNPGWTLVP